MKKWLSILLVVAFLIGFVAPLGEPVYAATEEDQPVYETQVEPAEETAPAEPAKPAEETAGVELPLPTETVVEDISEDESSSKMMEMRRLDANGAPALKATNEVEWIDRLADLPSYAWNFYYWLQENGDGDGQADALIDPTTGTHVNNEYYAYEIVRFESQKVSFSYGSNETAQSVANAIYAEETERLRAEVRAYMLATYAAFNRDHTEVFWFGGTTRNKMERSGSYNDNRNGTGVLTFNVSIYYVLMESDFDVRASEYRNKSVIYSTIADRDNRINNLAQTAKTKGNRYEQLKYLNDWLTKNNGYNSSSNLDNILRDARNCYGALVGRKGTQGPVCEGYARALKVVCNKLGIPCVLVDGTAISGSSSGPHMWNYVQMEDGKWYAMDVTWNDPGTTDIFVSGYENENYLLVGSQTFVGDRTFIESHPVKNNVHTGSTNFTNGPVLSTTKYNPNQAVTVTKIAIRTQPNKTTYWVGEALDTTGLTLTATYSNGTTQTVSSGFTFSGFNSTSAGTKTVIVAYEGKTTSFAVTVNAVTVTKIAIKSLPTKTTYWVGESLNTSGLTLTVTYSNGTTQDISTGFTTSGFSSSTTGTKTVTVTYSGKTATFTVTVNAATVTEIAIKSQPSKTTYWVGESLNTSGLELTVTYSDGSTQTVSSGFTTSGFSSTSAGTKTVTVTYSGKTTVFTVTVKASYVSSIAIKTKPTKISYEIGQSLDTSGLTLTVTYSDGTTKTISSGFATSGFSSTSAGTKTVTVTYEGKTTTFTVTVNAATVTKIAIKSQPSKTTYWVGESLNTSGLALTVTYSDGSTQTVTSGFTPSGFSSTTAGTKTVTISYGGKTATFTVTVKAKTPLKITTQPSSAVAKPGDTVSFTVAAQGEGVTYQWKYKNPGADAYVSSSLEGNKTPTLKVADVTKSHNGRQYICVVKDSFGERIESGAATLQIAYFETDAKDQTVEEEKYATFSVKFSITSGVTYQWQYKTSEKDDSWANSSMTGAKTNTMTVEGLEKRNGYLYRCKVTVSGQTFYSRAANLTVTERPPAIVTQPQSAIAKVGGSATFTVGTQGSGVTYQWKYKKPSSSTWSNVTSTGYKTATLKLENLTTSKNGYQYKCVVEDAKGREEETEIVTLWIAYITTDVKDQTVEDRQNATFSVAFSITEGVTYQWQFKSKADATSWSNTSMTGAKTNTLTVPAIMNRNGYLYRCKITVSGLEEPIYSKEVTLTVTERPPTIATQPESVVAKSGETVTFTVGTRGEGLTYQWKYKNATATTWSNTTLTGNKTDTLTVSNVNGPNHNGRQYKCVITDSYGEVVETEAVTLWVAYIVTDTKSKTVEEKQNATFTVDFSLTENVTYQWQYKGNTETSTWSNTSMTGAKTDTLTVPAIMDRNGYQYRCKITVTGLAEPIYSKEVTLTVTEKPPVIISQPKSVVTKNGETAIFTVGTQGEGLTYQWKYKNATATTWSNTTLTGNKTDTLTVSNVSGPNHNGRQYKCVITDSYGDIVETEAVTLWVAYIETDAKNKTVEEKQNATFTVAFSITEGVTYQWQFKSKADATSWSNTSMTGAKTNTLTVPAIMDRNGYQYRCKITVSGLAEPIYSKVVTLTVTEKPPIIVSQPKSITAQVGDTVTFTVGTQGEGLTYQWKYKNATATTWSNTSLPGYNTSTLTVSSLVGATHNGRQYMCVVTDSEGNVHKTEPATLTVAYLINDAKSQDVKIGKNAIFKVNYSVKSGVTYQWQYRGNTASSTWASTSSSGNKTDTLTVQGKATNNRYMYRCKITDPVAGTFYSKEVYLNIVEDAPEIITQPSDNSGVCGSYVTFTVEAIGAGISYQWQWSGDGGETWSNTMCNGYSTDTAFVKTNRFNSGYMYRCVVKTMNGSGYKRVYSEPATLTVLPAAEITQQLQDTVTVKAGDTVQLHIGAEGEGLTYQWQWAKFLGSWNNTTLLGYDTDTLTLAKVRADMNGRYYRVVITNAYGGTVETKYVRLFVK